MFKVIFGILFLMLAFQNCAQSKFNSLENTNSPSGKIDGGGTAFTKVQQTQIDLPNDQTDYKTSIKTITVDLIEKSVAFEFKNNESLLKACNLSDEKMNQLNDIVNQSKICTAEVPTGAVTCLAIGIPDFILSNSTISVELQPIICGHGKDLCGEASTKLRNYFKELAQSKFENNECD